MSGWISLSDKFPPTDEFVLTVYRTYSGIGTIRIMTYIADDHCFYDEDFRRTPLRNVTHWMLLPELPEAPNA